MSKWSKINSPADPMFEQMWSIYEYSFPAHEKRTKENLIASMESGAKVVLFHKDEKFAGFLIYWEFSTFNYIEHIAISDQMRNMGLGSTIIEQFIVQSGDKSVVLEIDPIVDEISERRSNFYGRLGFYSNGYHHLFPPYNDPNATPFEMILMSHGRKLTLVEFEEFKYRLYNTIVTY